MYSKTEDRFFCESDASGASEIPEDIDRDTCVEVPHKNDLDLGQDLVFGGVMTTITLTVTEAARHLSDYVNRIASRHESFVLCRGGKPVAELCPVSDGRRLGDLPGILRRLPHLSKRDAAAFAEDIERSGKALVADASLV